MKTHAIGSGGLASQCQKPRGWLGRILLWNMNKRHSRVTHWGLGQIQIERHFTILDVGCGGGRTLSKLAEAVPQGRAYGVDYSEESVAASKRTNAGWIGAGRVQVQYGSVSELPFQDATFDLITAVETHFWWPDLPAGFREIFRVLKAGGRLVVVAEIYKGANTAMAKLAQQKAPRIGMKLLDIEEHRSLFANTGYTEVRIIEESRKGWICGIGRKPMMEKPNPQPSARDDAH